MRFCTKCGSPVSGMSRFCTRCGAATSSAAGAGVASAAAAGTAEAGAAHAGSGSVLPDHTVAAEAAEPEPGQPGLTSQYNPAPAATVPPIAMSEDGGPLRLVQIGAEAEPEAWPEDPWLPGSRRPDRRALIIGVVLIAGLLLVASTAWLVRVSPPQASSPQGRQLFRPSRFEPGHAQPKQAFSGQPTPILTQPSQPAPTQTAAGPARPGQTGPSQAGHNQTGGAQAGHGQTGRNQASSGHPGASRSGTGPSHSGQPDAHQTGTHHTGSGQPAPGQTGPGPGPGQTGSGQSGPGQAGSAPSGTGHSGTGRGTAPTTPHPRQSPPGSRGGRAPRHSRPGVVSIAPGLAGRADARRVGGLLIRYFAAVNHRRYQAYASLFARRRQLTPRDFSWGYRTSHDSNAVLAGLARLSSGLKATVTFTSQQDPAQSPDHSSCIDWKITLFLSRAGATYLIGIPPPGYRAGLQACSFAPRQSLEGQASRHSSSKHGHREHH